MKTFGRILAPLTLLEWGGILTYFYCSGRIAAFLHPLFRPLVLLTGILLLLTAVCVAIFREEDCSHVSDEHDSAEHEADKDDHTANSHAELSFGRFLAFLILLLPLALAAKISPDNYGATLIKNRGLIEDIRGLPGIKGGSAQSIEPSSGMLSKTPESSPGSTVSPEPGPSASAIASTQKSEGTSDSVAPPSNGPPPGDTEVIGDAVVTYQNDFLAPNKEGNIKARVTDLLYAALEPSTRKDFEGKRVEIIGQFVREKTRTGKATVSADPSMFHLMRLVMVCCAADMMPAAVKIETARKPAQLREMSWLKVTGVVHFRPRAKNVGADGTDYGDYPEPVIVADKIANTPAPREKYIY
jgi:uncharacterized repeat protein (TIGR03943 family)